jgi:AraC family transcriptional regulator of adaptative response/methylated-DNA-[protein]-cysteine methyltransferase
VPSDDARWRAVLARRDRGFYYAVSTTGIYCRPSCASRRPRREHVSFFSTAAAAQAAGFRACLRCRPDAQRAAPPAVTAACAVLSRRVGERGESISVAELAEGVGVTPSQLHRLFVQTLGVSIKAYASALRLARLRRVLGAGGSATDAGYQAGFAAPSRLYADAERGLGMTPRQYQRGGDGLSMHYLGRRTRLGYLILAATERGLCFAQFASDRADGLARLRREFPRAAMAPATAADRAQLSAWIRLLVEHLRTGGPSPTLPLDVYGTAFQLRVWTFLRSLPHGARVTYAQVAAGVNRPRATRAAASACAANRIALAIPCHRVIRGDGGLGG